MDEEVEEDVDFEEYRLPELGEAKGKKPVEKKEETTKKQPGKSAAIIKKQPGSEVSQDMPELTEKELAEILDERGTAKPKEQKENAPFQIRENKEPAETGKGRLGEANGYERSHNENGSESEEQLGRAVVNSAASEENAVSTKVSPIERIPTGIDGLDELIEGGFPANSLVLVKGCAGAGKSIFGMNFLMTGVNNEEKTCYFSLEEPVEETKRQMRAFGWNLESLEGKGVLALKQPELYEFDELLTLIEETVNRMQAKRLVFDSISVLDLYFQDNFKLRRALIGFERMIKRLGCTAIVLSESCAGPGQTSCGVEDFVADGVIELGLSGKESVFQRTLFVSKMRATNHSLRVHPFQVEAGKGIVVYPGEKVLGGF